MGSITKTYTENYSSSYKSTWTFVFSASDITVTGASFTLNAIDTSAKYVYSGKNRAEASATYYVVLGGQTYWFEKRKAISAWNSGVTVNLPTDTFTYPASYSIPTSAVFNTSNKTTRTINLSHKIDQVWGWSMKGSSGAQENYFNNAGFSAILRNITLNAPPTCSYTQVQSDTEGRFYKDRTTASVDISNLSAKYGGDITECKLTIGSQSVTRTTNGRLSIKLNATGTFTPVVSLRDSRGQTATYSLSPIVVKNVPVYVKVGDTWKLATPKIKVGESWRDAKNIYVKVGNSWKQVF